MGEKERGESRSTQSPCHHHQRLMKNGGDGATRAGKDQVMLNPTRAEKLNSIRCEGRSSHDQEKAQSRERRFGQGSGGMPGSAGIIGHVCSSSTSEEWEQEHFEGGKIEKEEASGGAKGNSSNKGREDGSEAGGNAQSSSDRINRT